MQLKMKAFSPLRKRLIFGSVVMLSFKLCVQKMNVGLCNVPRSDLRVCMCVCVCVCVRACVCSLTSLVATNSSISITDSIGLMSKSEGAPLGGSRRRPLGS